MTSLFRQFSEIYNLSIQWWDRVDAQQKLQWSACNAVRTYFNGFLMRKVYKVFGLETTFTIDTKINSKKWSCLLSWSKEMGNSRKDNYTKTWTWSQGIMVSVGVTRMGNTKVNSEYYCKYFVKRGLLLAIQAMCGRHNWTLQQDGAPSYTARNTDSFLQENVVNFIEPPNSPH